MPTPTTPPPAAPPRRPQLALALAVWSGWLLAWGPAAAQQSGCRGDGRLPFICNVEATVARHGERPRRLDLERGLTLAIGSTVDLALEPFDQNGRRFPVDRAAFGITADRGCREAVSVDDLGDGAFRLRAGTRRASCRLLVWVAGNLGLEWTVPVAVEGISRGGSGYSREQAEYVAAALYRGILGREPDGEGLRAAAAEILRGRLAEQIENMLRSPEFQGERAALAPQVLLDEYYRGLFGRSADAGGVRTYLDRVARGRSAEVIVLLIESEEFEQRLLRRR